MADSEAAAAYREPSLFDDTQSFTEEAPPRYEGNSTRTPQRPAASNDSPVPWHPPIKTAASGDTCIEATLHKVRWGRYDGRPACLFVVKVSITEPASRSSLFSAHCSLNFPKKGADIVIIKQLPVRLAGPKVKPNQAAYIESIGADTGFSTLRSSWQLEGEVKVGNGGDKSAVWDVTSDLSTNTHLPKELRLGLIVDYGVAEQPFDVGIEVRPHRRSLMGSMMRPKGESALVWVRLQPEASEACLTETDLRFCVSSSVKI